MDCYEFRNHISDFIDGELTYKKQEKFKQHRSICPQCRQILENTLKAVRSLNSLPSLEVSDNFLSNLHSRIQAVRDNQLALAEKKKGFSLEKLPSFTYGAAAAALVLAVGFAVMKMQSQSEPVLSQPQTPVKTREMIQPSPPPNNSRLVKSNLPETGNPTNRDSSDNQKTQPQFQNRIKMVNETNR